MGKEDELEKSISKVQNVVDHGGSSSGREEGDETKLICCVLCYCAADYSDKTYFCQEARDADLDLEGDQPKLLPLQLFDPQNALVFCDSCDRPYHQRCHFTPVINLPRGDWHCFICTSTPQLVSPSRETTKKGQTNKKKNMKKQRDQEQQQQQPKEQRQKKQWTKRTLEKELYQMNKPWGNLELRWEFDVRTQKIAAFKIEMRRLRGGLSQQLQNIRLAQMSLKAFTTGRRALSTAGLLNSQELSQTMVKLSSAKLRVRQLFQSLEMYMKGDDPQWNILIKTLEEDPKEIPAWFPFGQHPRRQVPRLRDEPKENKKRDHIPQHIHVNSNTCKEESGNYVFSSKNATMNDDDSGISLDNLKCCVCFRGDATDNNDLLMCDGLGCFRAHHMHCLQPIMTPEKASEEEDWFCPLCTTLAKLVGEVQSEYTGDNWQDEENGSVASWEQVDDIFPEAEKEYKMTMNWKKNKIDDETKSYLMGLFGDDNDKEFEMDEPEANDSIALEDDDDDDDYDPEQKRNDKVENNNIPNDSDSDDDDSSNATLQDMSSVELHIGKGELNALSGEESVESESGDDRKNNDYYKNEEGIKQPSRRSCRSRSTRFLRANNNNPDKEDIVKVRKRYQSTDNGALDESNILLGKRRRRKIDYRKLNDSMFGKLSAKEKKKIDDHDDFQYMAPTRTTVSSSCSEADELSSEVDEIGGDTERSTSTAVSDEESIENDNKHTESSNIHKPVSKKLKTTKENNIDTGEENPTQICGECAQ